MLRRALVLGCVLVSGCKHWKVIEQGETSPLAGQSKVVLLPLSWAGVQIDGDPESKWLAGLDDDGRKGWPGDQADGNAEFRRGLVEALAGGPIHIADPADPSGATCTLKPEVAELATGGRRPTIITVNVSVLDARGTTVEKVSTRGEWKNMFIGMNSRLKAAAEIAGQNAADYLKARSK